jgi:hypothetical protein
MRGDDTLGPRPPLEQDVSASEIVLVSLIARARLSIIVLLTLMGLLVPSQSLHAKSGKIRVLLTGRVDEGRLITSWFINEPMMAPIFVPSRNVAGGDAQIRKFVRIYFPRNYAGVQIQDFILFEGTQMAMFSPTQQKWMHDAVLEGTGGLNSRGLLSTQYFQEWQASPTQKAFPNDVEAVIMAGSWDRPNRNTLIIPEEGLPPVFTMFIGLNVQWYLPGYRCTLVIPRRGAVVWTWIKGPWADKATQRPGCTPHTISWQYGKGTTWTTHDSLTDWWQDRAMNPYGLDMIMNMILHSTGRSLPEDIQILHDIRSRLAEFRSGQFLVLAVADFGESFGANMNPILEDLGTIIAKKGKVDELYTEQEYPEARAGYMDVIDDLERLTQEAIDVKDRAMTWVYVLQWFAVSGTAMLAGFLLWSLMVRRRLFRAVDSTRLAGR